MKKKNLKNPKEAKAASATQTADRGHPHTQPHDRLFKEVFSTREAQQDLVGWRCRRRSPPVSAWRRCVNRDKKRERPDGPASHRRDERRRTEYVYVLVEHKSYPAPMVAVQLLGYVGGILKRYVNRRCRIHPVVFYHGDEDLDRPTELTGCTGLGDHHDRRDAGRTLTIRRSHPPGGYPVNLRYHLFDLSTIPPEQIAERARAQAYTGMIAMKYIKRNLKPGDIRIIARVVARTRLPGDLWFTITTYVLDQVEQQYRQPLMTAITENVYTEEEGKRMKSIADAIREEGMMTGPRTRQSGRPDPIVAAPLRTHCGRRSDRA